jgi:excisionase family DNA binding protein
LAFSTSHHCIPVHRGLCSETITFKLSQRHPNPVHTELTTQPAADFLNVSRPYLIGLLEGKKLSSRKVGTHRRVLFKDLVEHKNSVDGKRSEALDELAKQAQDLGLGY